MRLVYAITIVLAGLVMLGLLWLQHTSESAPSPTPVSSATAPAEPPAPRAIAVEPATPPEDERAAALRAYTLAPGEVLRHIGQPYPRGRALAFAGSPLPPGEDGICILRYLDGKPLNEWQVLSVIHGLDGYSLVMLINDLCDVEMADIEGEGGDRTFLNMKLPGDYVVREGAAREELFAALQKIYRDETTLDLSIGYRDVKRDAYILRGTWNYQPVANADFYSQKYKDANPQVHLYAFTMEKDRWDAHNWEGSGHDLRNGLHARFRLPVDLEVQGMPQAITVYQHDERDSGQDYDKIHDPVLTLKHVAEQTGLTWTKELRTIRRVVVEARRDQPRLP